MEKSIWNPNCTLFNKVKQNNLLSQLYDGKDSCFMDTLLYYNYWLLKISEI